MRKKEYEMIYVSGKEDKRIGFEIWRERKEDKKIKKQKIFIYLFCIFILLKN